MVGLSKKRVFPKTKGDSITGQDRAQKHCDFRFSQIEKKSKVAVLQLNRALRCLTSQHWSDTLRVTVKASSYSEAVCVSYIPVVPITTTGFYPGVPYWELIQKKDIKIFFKISNS